MSKFHAISGGAEYNEGMGGFIAESGMTRNVREAYHVTAIFGAQSSGKSTLLNLLFGTRFDVMNEDTGPSQTTKGVWVSKADSHNTLVFDVEGTDSRERGDDTQLERKCGLFALAVGEVLIINMWCRDVGRFNASNMGLLRTIFEVNLQVFQQAQTTKTLLLFVLRDHTKMPKDGLVKALRESIDSVWAQISKPDNFAESSVTDFFDLDYVTLPHMELMRPEFDASVAELRRRFGDPAHPEYLFQDKYTKTVPIDGFPQYAESLWGTIAENRDLDIPTQKELLSLHRCEEIAAEIRGTFEATVEEAGRERDTLGATELMPNLAARIRKWMADAVEVYEERAGHYIPSVVEKKEMAMRSDLLQVVQPLVASQLARARKQAAAAFESSLAKWLPKSKVSAARNFAANASESRAKAVAAFTELVKDVVVPEEGLGADDAREELERELDRCIKDEKSAQLGRLVAELKSASSKDLLQIEEQVERSPLPANLWTKVQETLDACKGRLDSLLQDRLAEFDASEAEQEDVRGDVLVRQYAEQVRDVVQGLVRESVLLNKVKSEFDHVFKYDNGRPRRWSPGDNVDEVFDSALEQGNKALSALSSVELPGVDVEVERTQVQALRDQLKQHAESMYVDAQDRINMRTPGGIPTWVFVLLGVLGFNEFLAVLTSPSLFFLVFALATTAYAVFVFVPRPVLEAAAAQASKMVQDKIAELQGGGLVGVGGGAGDRKPKSD